MKRAIAIALLCAGCLPGDNRPEPATITVSAEASAPTKSGFTTSDGWNISFDRVVIAVGDSFLEPAADGSGDCNSYADNIYNRLFDFTQVEREHVGIVYGLGHCGLGFAIRTPNSATVLGPGVTSADVRHMQLSTLDDEWELGLSVIVSGQASKDATVKRFDWAFNGFAILSECPTVQSDSDFVSVFQLEGGDRIDVTLEARAQELFRLSPNDDEPVAFDHIAVADIDDDGEVTFEELGLVDAPQPTVEPDDDDEPVPADRKLNALVHLDLAPRIVRIKGGGACHANTLERTIDDGL